MHLTSAPGLLESTAEGCEMGKDVREPYVVVLFNRSPASSAVQVGTISEFPPGEYPSYWRFNNGARTKPELVGFFRTRDLAQAFVDELGPKPESELLVRWAAQNGT